MAAVAAEKTSGKRKRHDLTLKEKYEVIQQVQKHVPFRNLAEKFNCSLGQISHIVEKRAEIEEMFELNANSKIQRINQAPNRAVN